MFPILNEYLTSVDVNDKRVTEHCKSIIGRVG